MIEIVVATPLAPTRTHFHPELAGHCGCPAAGLGFYARVESARSPSARHRLSGPVTARTYPGSEQAGTRESVWIGPARRHAPSVRVAGRGFYLAVWAMPGPLRHVPHPSSTLRV